MKTLLVPVDFSAVTKKVVDGTLGLARAIGGKVSLLHVVQPPVDTMPEYALPVDVIQDALSATENAARKKLAALSGRFGRAGIACEAALQVGTPVSLILERARKIKADYIVMGSHGHGKLYDLLVGSTASGVLKKTRCGVVILPSGEKRR
jgi:nucleotide-binding universal stress UspA family protein